MELPSTIARWEGDRLTVWDKAQGINATQAVYGKAFGISADNVRVICPFIGGAFGSAGGTWPHQIMTAFAAKQVRRPVKLVLTRKQMYNSIGFRPASRQRLAIGADRAGAITVIVHEGRTESAHYQSFEDSSRVRRRFSTTARICARRTASYRWTSTWAVRCGPRGDAGAFVLNQESTTSPTASRSTHRAENSQPTGSGPDEQSAVLDASAPRLPHTGRRRIWVVAAEPGPRSTRDGDELIGIGMAAAGYHTNRSESDAEVRINVDGTTDVFSATCDMGPGTYTSMTQVAADALGLPMRRVRFSLGDSRFPKAPSHSGSRTMASVGSAPSSRRTPCGTNSFGQP